MTKIARRRFMQATAATTVVTAGITLSSKSVSATQPDQGDWLKTTNGSRLLGIIHPKDDNEFNYPYKLLLPPNPSDAERPLYYEESARGPDNYVTSMDELVSTAKQSQGEVIDAYLKDYKNNVPILVPLFPTTPNDGPKDIAELELPGYRKDNHPNISSYYTLEQYTEGTEFEPESLRRIDKQLVAMIEHATELIESTQPYTISDDGLRMFGFSAGSAFVDRFATLHPEYVAAYAVGGKGASMLPMEEYELDSGETVELPFPLGTADYQQITGHEFDFEEWKSIDKFLFLGELDTPHEEEGSHIPDQTYVEEDEKISREIFGEKEKGLKNRFLKSKEIYNEVGANATFKIYSGIGHTPYDSRVERDLYEFYTEHMNYTSEPSANSNSEASTDTDDGQTDGNNDGTDTDNDQTNADDDESDTNYAGYWPVIGVILGLAAIILKSQEESS